MINNKKIYLQPACGTITHLAFLPSCLVYVENQAIFKKDEFNHTIKKRIYGLFIIWIPKYKEIKII